MNLKKNEGRTAAYNGFGVDTNPYKKRTNDHRDWTEGHASVEQSNTPLDHTFERGDVVRYRTHHDREMAMDRGEEPFMIIVKTRDVPKDQQTYDPSVAWRDSTGVGHHQHLFVEGRNAPISGAIVEIVKDEEGPLRDAIQDYEMARERNNNMPTLGSILEAAMASHRQR